MDSSSARRSAGILKNVIRGEPGDGQFVDVSFERAAVQQLAGNVVEPETLAFVMKQLCGVRRVTSLFAN